MLKGKTQVAFRIVAGLVFIIVGAKNCMSGDYLFGGISLIAGIAFVASLFLKKSGANK